MVCKRSYRLGEQWERGGSKQRCACWGRWARRPPRRSALATASPGGPPPLCRCRVGATEHADSWSSWLPADNNFHSSITQWRPIERDRGIQINGGTSKEGPGCHPGMERRAAAGLMEAGSVVVATTSVTISADSSLLSESQPSCASSVKGLEDQYNWGIS